MTCGDNRTIFLINLLLLMSLGFVYGNDLLTSSESLFVSKMQEVFMIKDGSFILDPQDVTVVSALRKELRSIITNYTSLTSLNGFRNSTLVSDQDISLILMLAVMGNFHRKSVTNTDVYDDVQIVFDPLDGKFVILQNLRDTEMTVFKALLVLSVAGLLLIFMIEKKQESKRKEDVVDGRMTESKMSASYNPLHLNTFGSGITPHIAHENAFNAAIPIHTIKFRK